MKIYRLFFLSFLVFLAAGCGGGDQTLERAVKMQKDGNNEGALKIYNTLLRQKPDYFPALVNRAMVYERLQDDEKAQKDYDAALKIDSTNVQLLNNVGSFFTRKGEAARALIYLDKAISLNSGYLLAYINRALAKNEMGLYSSALQDYEEVLLYDPENQAALTGKAVSLYNLGDNIGAILLLTEVIYHDPQNPKTYYRRAIAERAAEQYANALLDYAAAVELNAQYTEARFGKAELLYKKGDYQAALGEIDVLKGYNNQYAPSYELAGDILAYEDPQSAVANFKVAAKLDPANAKRYEAKIRLMDSPGGREKVLLDTFRSK